MPTITTYAKPIDGFVTVRIPDEYEGKAFEVMLFPISCDDFDMADHAMFQANPCVANAASNAKFGQDASEMFDFLMSQHGSRTPGYVFDREEANARR